MVGLRTISLPVNAGADWSSFAFPDRALGDRLPYGVDAADWLLDGTEVVQGVSVIVSAGLTLGPLSYVLTNNVITGWIVAISGGVPGLLGTVEFIVNFVNRDVLDIQIGLMTRMHTDIGPVVSPAPAGAITVGGVVVSVAGQVPTVGTAVVQRGLVTVGGQIVTVGGQNISVGVYI